MTLPSTVAYQWAAIVPKEAMHFKSGEDNLHFYSTNLKEMKYVLPCKVSCERGSLLLLKGADGLAHCVGTDDRFLAECVR